MVSAKITQDWNDPEWITIQGSENKSAEFLSYPCTEKPDTATLYNITIQNPSKIDNHHCKVIFYFIKLQTVSKLAEKALPTDLI